MSSMLRTNKLRIPRKFQGKMSFDDFAMNYFLFADRVENCRFYATPLKFYSRLENDLKSYINTWNDVETARYAISHQLL